jgi:hypothetical protein
MAPRATARSSAKPPPTRISAEHFALSGPSQRPDPDHNAYRKDLADVELAGTVIASHYVEPVERVMQSSSSLRSSPSAEGAIVRELASGEPFALLDERLGWAWGYAGTERRVGYVRSDALAIP